MAMISQCENFFKEMFEQREKKSKKVGMGGWLK
jgi:hypothetical protein